jgi:hypothetical protein
MHETSQAESNAPENRGKSEFDLTRRFASMTLDGGKVGGPPTLGYDGRATKRGVAHR